MASEARPSVPPLEALGRRVPVLAGILLALTLGVLALRPVTSPDVWWHLAMGRATWEAGSFTYPDPVALGARSEYVNIVWLFDVPLYLLHRVGGLVAVNLAVGALAALSFLACWHLARESAGSTALWTPLLVASLAAGATHLRFVPRPQSVFLVLLPMVLWLARRSATRAGREAWIYRGALILVVAVWAHIHASVVAAPIVAAVAAIPWSWSHGAGWRWRPTECGSSSLLLGLERGQWLTLLVVGLLPLSGPSGPALVWRVLVHRENYSVRHIAEMQPMKLEWWFVPTRDILFAEVLLLIAVVGLLWRRRLPVGPAALAVFGLMLTLNTNRFAAAWAVMMVPLVTGVLVPESSREGWGRAGVAILALVGVPVVLSFGSQVPSFWPGPSFPEGAARAIERLGVRGAVFNTYDAGGYLGWRLYGRVRVLFDSRAQMHFDVEELYAGDQALRDPEIFRRLHRVHRFAAAVVPRGQPLCGAMAGDVGWDGVWLSQNDALFLPAGSSPHALRHLEPCIDETLVRRCRESGMSTSFLAEIAGLLEITPGDPHLGRLGALLALQCAGPPALDRARDLLGVAAAEPSDPGFVWLSGLALAAAEETEGALVVLEKLPVEHAPGQALRLQLLRRLERPEEALGIAAEQVARLDDRSPRELRELYAWACEETGDHDCAVRETLRAAVAGSDEARRRLALYVQREWVPVDMEKVVAAALSDV